MNIIDSASESIARARLIQSETRKSVDQLRGTIESQQMAQKIVQLESKAQTTYKLLAKHCDEIEATFDNDEQFDSPESAQDYLNSAKWLHDNFGRTNNRIEDVQRWLNEYLPFK